MSQDEGKPAEQPPAVEMYGPDPINAKDPEKAIDWLRFYARQDYNELVRRDGRLERALIAKARRERREMAEAQYQRERERAERRLEEREARNAEAQRQAEELRERKLDAAIADFNRNAS